MPSDVCSTCGCPTFDHSSAGCDACDCRLPVDALLAPEAWRAAKAGAGSRRRAAAAAAADALRRAGDRRTTWSQTSRGAAADPLSHLGFSATIDGRPVLVRVILPLPPTEPFYGLDA